VQSVKIIDLGSGAEDATVNQVNILTTPEYMPPELLPATKGARPN